MDSIRDKAVTVVGLGLMGGSLALALQPHVASLTGVEVDGDIRALARRRKVVGRVTGDLAEGITGADVVILATPVRSIIALLGEIARLGAAGCLLLDLGSSKGEICRAMDTLPKGYVALGGHPMCGKETAGLPAADPNLYSGQTFVLCRTARTTATAEALAVELVQAIGSQPLFLAPDRHDELVALVSHLPYFLSALLMEQASAAASSDGRVWTVSASGFRDMSRLAGSDPRMMLDIVSTNRTAILSQLEQYRDGLLALMALLQSEDEAVLGRWLADRQREQQVYRSEQ